MISVCMATYNGEKYIKDQLYSIIVQLDQNDEIVISDDGSKDRTISEIEKIGDPRIKLYRNVGKHGFTPNFENALKHAKGDYIFLADQDDVWAPDKVKVTMQALNRANFVVSDCVTVDADMNVIQKSRFASFNIKGGFLRHLIKSRYIGCCMAFDRKMLDATIPFPTRYDLVEHDIWIAAVGFLYFKFELLSEPLIYYRRHGNNTSEGGFSDGYSLFNKVWRRVYRIISLIKIQNKVRRIKANN